MSSLIGLLVYRLWCKPRGCRMTAWFDASGPDGTMARFCARCHHTEHLIGGEVWTSWPR